MNRWGGARSARITTIQRNSWGNLRMWTKCSDRLMTTLTWSRDCCDKAGRSSSNKSNKTQTKRYMMTTGACACESHPCPQFTLQGSNENLKLISTVNLIIFILVLSSGCSSRWVCPAEFSALRAVLAACILRGWELWAGTLSRQF